MSAATLRGGDPGIRARPAALVLLPRPQRGGQPRGPGRGGARHPAGDRRHVRDHRRGRRLEGRDARDRGTSGRRAPEAVRAVHTARTRVTAPPCARAGGVPVRPLCFTDGDRQFRIADLARLTARMTEPDSPSRRRVPDQARGPVHPDGLRAGYSTPAGCSSASGGRGVDCACEAVPSRGTRGHPGRLRRRVFSASADPARDWGGRRSRSACHPTEDRGSPTRARSRASSGAR